MPRVSDERLKEMITELDAEIRLWPETTSQDAKKMYLEDLSVLRELLALREAIYGQDGALDVLTMSQCDLDQTLLPIEYEHERCAAIAKLEALK